MCQITAAQVKELREITNVGMMECKKALQESKGNQEEAIKLLRERGLAIAAKKASRIAEQGLITSCIAPDKKTGSLIEVNCETDFVAKNETFKDFVESLAEKALLKTDGELAASVKDEVAAKISEIGENIVVKRNVLFKVDAVGAVAEYIHPGGKVGVLMELGFTKEKTTSLETYSTLARDLCMHVAACNPQALSREDVDPALLEAEREIYKKQMEGKPPEILDKIIGGKIEKFYSQVCMLEQGFVKDPDIQIKALLEKVGKELDDVICLHRFKRYQLN